MRAECLNLKSEWAGSKILALSVSNPKGLMHQTEGINENQEGAETYREPVRRGCKILSYHPTRGGESEDEVSQCEDSIEVMPSGSGEEASEI